MSALCDWYLAEAEAGRILGRRRRPIKTSTLAMDRSRIETHIKPLLGARFGPRLVRAARIRGRADDGRDLVISREYISRGFRDRAAERVTLELGPRSEREIRIALVREVEAERWTSLDRALRDIADECDGVADLRPGPGAEDPELRRLLLGRAAKLERLGLADPVGPACWTLKPRLEEALRQLGFRGDIIKTMHQAMSAD